LGIIIVALIILIAIIYILWNQNRQGLGKSNKLRQQARKMLHAAPDAADEIVDRQLRALQKRHPGQTEEWYLEKIIYDLERDR